MEKRVAPDPAPVQVRLQEKLVKRFGSGINVLEPHRWSEYGLTIGVARETAFSVFKALKEEADFLFNMLIDVTAVDWLDTREAQGQQRFEVVYQLLSLTFNHRLQVKVQTSEEKPEVDSVLPLWPAANFLEREVWDMYGISFKGHGDLRRILMYDEFEGHPLRKDYPLRGKQPRVTLRMPELRNDSEDMIRSELVSELVSLPSRPRVQS